MKIAIIFGTKHGSAQECALHLAEKITCKVSVYNLSKKEVPLIDDVDMVIMGSSVYAGRLNKEVLTFANNHQEKLLQKKLMLFTCNMHRGEEEEKQLRNIFPEELTRHAQELVSFGGKFDFSKLNFLEKVVIKKVAKVTTDIEDLRFDAIEALAERINAECV